MGRGWQGREFLAVASNCARCCVARQKRYI
jgi:hypothetical protein